MADSVITPSTKTPEDRSGVIRNFAPSWFAAVMGTGALALGLFAYQSRVPALAAAGRILFVINIVLFIVLFVPWTLRWILHPRAVISDLRHPILSNFFPTISAGIVVLAIDFIVIGQNSAIGFPLWLIGSIGTIIFSILTPYVMFTSSSVRLDHMNPGFFIPPVALLVIPLGGGLILPHLSGPMADLAVVLNFFGFGAGLLLYLALSAITLYRFILHDPLPSALAATVWINLGPLGAGAAGLINIAKATSFITIKEPFFVASFFLWGFAVWWLLMAVVMSLHYIGRMKFPYGLAWWGFTFPTGAFVLASHALAGVFKVPLVDHIGFVVLWLLVAMWLLTVVKTVQRSFDGTLFRPVQSAPVPQASDVERST